MGFNFGSFAGGLSDSLSEQQRLAAQQQAERQNTLAQMAWGNALGGTMPAPPQQNNPIQGFLAKIGLGGAQPPVAQPQQPQQPGPIGGQPMPSAPPPGAQPQGGRLGSAPPMPQAQPMQPQNSPQNGGMTFEQWVERIKKYNPGIGPLELAAAAKLAQPYLNAQAQQQVRFLNLGEKVRHDEATEGQGDRRLNQGDEKIHQGEERINLAIKQNEERFSAMKEKMDAAMKDFEEKLRHHLVSEGQKDKKLGQDQEKIDLAAQQAKEKAERAKQHLDNIIKQFGEMVRHHKVTEGQTDRRGDQTDRKLGQGDTKLKQDEEKIQQTKTRDEERINLAKQRLSAAVKRYDDNLAEKQYEFDSASSDRDRKAAFTNFEKAVKAKRTALQSYLQAGKSVDSDLKPQLVRAAQEQLKEADDALEAARVKTASGGAKRTNRFPEPAGEPGKTYTLENPPKIGDVWNGYRLKKGTGLEDSDWEKVK